MSNGVKRAPEGRTDPDRMVGEGNGRSGSVVVKAASALTQKNRAPRTKPLLRDRSMAPDAAKCRTVIRINS